MVEEDKAVTTDPGEGLTSPEVKVWRLVLTGGPCGGKTTAQVRILLSGLSDDDDYDVAEQASNIL